MTNREELSKKLNELGNALTVLEWPTKEVKRYGRGTKVYDTKEIFSSLAGNVYALMDVEKELTDCVNELCLKCGAYRNEHLGVCDHCRWKETKDWIYGRANKKTAGGTAAR